jgi:transcription elongation factor GreB
MDKRQAADDAAGDESPALPDGIKNYMTPRGFQQLRDELQRLMRVERPKVVEIVSWAAGNGDRSENGDYIYGKRRLREIDRRVRFLSKRLDVLTVVREAPTDPSRVFFGAWVTLEDDDGEEVTYRIVGPDESNVELGWISMEAPVAMALLGKRDGDDVLVKRPKGNITFTIVGIRYHPPDEEP